jgi:hypothetical protein
MVGTGGIVDNSLLVMVLSSGLWKTEKMKSKSDRLKPPLSPHVAVMNGRNEEQGQWGRLRKMLLPDLTATTSLSTNNTKHL